MHGIWLPYYYRNWADEIREDIRLSRFQQMICLRREDDFDTRIARERYRSRSALWQYASYTDEYRRAMTGAHILRANILAGLPPVVYYIARRYFLDASARMSMMVTPRLPHEDKARRATSRHQLSTYIDGCRHRQ